MTSLRNFLLRNIFHRDSILSLLIISFAYGIFIPWLGFYWDDWQFLFPASTGRFIDLAPIMSIDRPFGIWFYWLTLPTLGLSPLLWQLTGLIIRWLTSLVMTAALNLMWPYRRAANWLAGLYFAIYPAFRSQAIAVTYLSHFVAASFFFTSLIFTYKSLQRKEHFNYFLAAGLFLEAAHLLTMEYFSGLEIFRPLFILLVISKNYKFTKQDLKRSVKLSFPYLLVLGVYSFWRLTNPLTTRLDVTDSFFHDIAFRPLEGLLHFGTTVWNQISYLLFTSWKIALDSIALIESQRVLFIAIFAGICSVIFIVIWATKKTTPKQPSSGGMSSDGHAILIGFIALATGLVPIWLIGITSFSSTFSDRFAFPALFGSAIILVNVVRLLITSPRNRMIIYSLLISLAVVFQIKVQNDFRLAWKELKNIHTQLLWRAPDIMSETSLVSYGRWSFMADNNAAILINSIYPQSLPSKQLDYWLYDLEDIDWETRIRNNELLTAGTRTLIAQEKNLDSRLFFYMPQVGCLWVLNPIDHHSKYLPAVMREFVHQSKPNRILEVMRDNLSSTSTIFSEEESNTWCFYFQKSALANQFGRWEESLAYTTEALAKDLKPAVGIELLPALQSSWLAADWAQANKLLNMILRTRAKDRALLCHYWQSFTVSEGSVYPASYDSEIRSLKECIE
jgi:hypothetical protein